MKPTSKAFDLIDKTMISKAAKDSNKMQKEMTDLCFNCKKRKASINWVGSGSTMDYVHGNYSRWCTYCSTKAQLKEAKRRAKQAPKDVIKLEKKLARLK